MTPAMRWAIGIALLVVAAALWMFWKPGDQPQAPAKVEPAKAPVAAAPAVVPVAATPAPAAVAEPPKEEPISVTVFFDFDRSAVRSGDAPTLDELTAKIKGRTFDHLAAVGHSDRIGTAPYNTQLSQKRAEAVAAYLATKGVETGRIRTEGKGGTQNVTGDACKDMGPESGENQKLVECLQRDRRVEIRLVASR